MKKTLLLLSLVFVGSAQADTCGKNLTGPFPAGQANAICQKQNTPTITTPTIVGKISGTTGINVSPTLGVEGVTGTGSVTGDAAVLSATKQTHQLIGANGTLAWRLSTPVAGDLHIFMNTTAGVAKIFPPTGGTINGAAADAVFTALTGIKPIICVATSTTAFTCS